MKTKQELANYFFDEIIDNLNKWNEEIKNWIFSNEEIFSEYSMEDFLIELNNKLERQLDGINNEIKRRFGVIYSQCHLLEIMGKPKADYMNKLELIFPTLLLEKQKIKIGDNDKSFLKKLLTSLLFIFIFPVFIINYIFNFPKGQRGIRKIIYSIFCNKYNEIMLECYTKKTILATEMI